MSEFVTVCPQCRQRILGDTNFVGQRVACPLCLHEIIMPDPPAIQTGQPKALPVSSPAPAAPGRNQNALVLVVVVAVIVALVFAGAFVLKRQGASDLSTPATPVAATPPVAGTAPKPATPTNKATIVFSAQNATLHGTKMKLEWRGDRPNVGYWNDPEEWVSWKAVIPQSGKYQLSLCVACGDGESELMVEVGAAAVSARVLKTENFDTFSTVDIGFMEIKQAGEMAVSVRPKNAGGWNPINLNSVQLTPVDFSR